MVNYALKSGKLFRLLDQRLKLFLTIQLLFLIYELKIGLIQSHLISDSVILVLVLHHERNQDSHIVSVHYYTSEETTLVSSFIDII
jgi:hypothetical protein